MEYNLFRKQNQIVINLVYQFEALGYRIVCYKTVEQYPNLYDYLRDVIVVFSNEDYTIDFYVTAQGKVTKIILEK